MNNEQFENEHVHKFYSEQSSQFNITRRKPWPYIQQFIYKYDRPNQINLDCGCGNGRNLHISKYNTFIGLDYSFELLQYCNTNSVHVSGSSGIGSSGIVGSSGIGESIQSIGSSGSTRSIGSNDSTRSVGSNVHDENGTTHNTDESIQSVCSKESTRSIDTALTTSDTTQNTDTALTTSDTTQNTDTTLHTSTHQYKYNLVRGDVLQLPFKDNTFNLIISIAVIHHLSTHERRIQALYEMKRCLHPNGRILLYVWDESTKHKSKFTQISNKNYFVKFSNTFDRYYYLYDKEELKQDCMTCGFIVHDVGIEQESIYIELSK